MMTRASVISTAKTAVEALPTSTRMNSRSGAGQPMASERHLDPRSNRGAYRIGDPGTGQDQTELQIKPGRPDLGAHRSRGGEQKFADVVQVHRQHLIASRNGIIGST